MHMKQRFGYSVHAKHSCSFSQSKLLLFPNLGRATTNATAAKTSVKKSAPRCFFILCRSVCQMLMNLSGVEFLVSIKLRYPTFESNAVLNCCK